MRKIFTLTTSVLNGTVTVSTSTCGFLSRELAEKALEAVEMANKGITSSLRVVNKISEIDVYEKEEEVPILRETNNQNS